MIKRRQIGVLAPTLLFAVMVMSQRAQADVRQKTVGDILNKIERTDRGRNLKMQNKSETALPKSERLKRERIDIQYLHSIKPPRSSSFYRNESADESALEKLTDQQIEKLYSLTQQYRHSRNRGELWLRLGELYSEKAQQIEFRKQREYDRKLSELEGKKSASKPKLDLREADDFNRRSAQLYEWFLRDFPNDEKVDQALFFLGYNLVQLGRVKEGVARYTELTKRFPRSPYVSESYFALGEYYFDNEQWSKANENYHQVISRKSPRLYDFALYKSAWCFYRLGQSSKGLRYLDAIVKRGRSQAEAANIEGRKEVNRLRLAAEARKDMVAFYADTRDCQRAESYFFDVTGNEQDTLKMLEALAYSYSASGHRDCSRYLFRSLISKNPTSPKAFDYQYQIVQNYLNVEKTKAFQQELFRWIALYGPNSSWAKDKASDKQLLQYSYNLQESTLRNYVLQLHQAAQNSRGQASQKEASEGYLVYLQAFGSSKQASEMHFFYGELLFDQKKWNEAASQYLMVSEKDPKSKLGEKAATNALIALDKTLPDDKAVRDRLGAKTDPQPFDPPVARFEVVAKGYLQEYPRAPKAVEVKFRLGRLHYAYSHLDEALAVFKAIVQDYPRTKYAEYAANLILDIYDLKKDYVGLSKAGSEILANPALANTDAGFEARGVVERTSFKKAQDLEQNKKYGESAREFESFAKSNPKSSLALAAQYNAGVNYDRAGDSTSAFRLYGAVLAAPTASRDPKQTRKNEDLKGKTRKLMAGLLQISGQYREAAVQYEKYASENQRDPEAPAFHFNAAVLFDGLDESTAAARNYEQYAGTKQADRKEAYYYLAEMYRRQGQRAKALAAYEKYLASDPSDAQKTLDANYQIAVLTEASNRAKAMTWYNRTVSVHKALVANGKTVRSANAAQARLKLALAAVAQLKEIRIPNNPAKQQAAVQQKLTLITKVNSEMADVIRYDHGPTIAAALVATGEAYDHMYQSISQTSVPVGLSAAELKQYQEGIQKIVTPFRDKALENYRAAIQRGTQLEAYGDWMVSARRGVRRYAPTEALSGAEKGSDLRVPDWVGL